MRAFFVLTVAGALAGCALDAAGLASTSDAVGGEDVQTTREAGTSHDAGAPHEASATLDSTTDSPAKDSSHEGGDAAKDAGKDAAVLDVAAIDSAPPACSVPPGACVAGLPPGWTLVAFEGSQAAPCPPPLAGVDVVSSPVALAGACGCACDVTTPPVCDNGNLARMVSDDSSCSQTGVVLTVNGGGCTAWPSGSSGLDSYGEATALPAVNGACTASPTTDPANVTTTPGRVCSLPTDCEEQACEGGAPTGFSLCIAESGAQASCPAGWGTPLVVGTSVDLACSACTCDVNGPSTCSSASLALFKDPNCNSSLATLAVDGACVADPAAGKTPASFEYSATLNQVCTTDGAKTATVSLASPETICCKP